MEVRRVYLFLSRPPFLPLWALHPPVIRSPLSFVPPEGASLLVPNFKDDYVFYNEGGNFKPLNSVAATASLFPSMDYGITVFEVDINTAFIAEIFEALAKFTECHHVCSFLECVNVELLV